MSFSVRFQKTGWGIISLGSHVFLSQLKHSGQVKGVYLRCSAFDIITSVAVTVLRTEPGARISPGALPPSCPRTLHLHWDAQKYKHVSDLIASLEPTRGWRYKAVCTCSAALREQKSAVGREEEMPGRPLQFSALHRLEPKLLVFLRAMDEGWLSTSSSPGPGLWVQAPWQEMGNHGTWMLFPSSQEPWRWQGVVTPKLGFCGMLMSLAPSTKSSRIISQKCNPSQELAQDANAEAERNGWGP